MTNGQVVLKSRPGPNGAPSNENFAYEECEEPTSSLEEGEVQIKSLYLSVDPALRCQMNENTGAHYLEPWQLGKPIIGLSGVGKVLKSKHVDFQKGDHIVGSMYWPWIRHFNVNVNEKHECFQKVDSSIFGHHLSWSMSGLVGVTSLLGMRQVGMVKSGQTLVVSGAAGACGSIAAQVGHIDGCTNVVGICGSAGKCEWLTKELGLQHAINYKQDNVADKLKQSCPQGIDVYFDNVGGEISDEVIKQMNEGGVIVLCGQISQYNKDVPYPPPLSPDIQEIVTKKNIKRDRFLVLDYKYLIPEAHRVFFDLLHTGKIKYRETVTKGLEHAGEAFVSMMKGGNIGKQIVKV